MSKKRGVFGFLICSILLLSLFTGFCMSNKKVSAITRTSDRIRKAVNTSEIPESYTPIYTVDDLVAINLNPKGNYILMNDIDLTEATAEGGSLDTGHGWTPLDSFSGVLDGNGYRIKGMHIYGDYTYETKSFRRCLGLFSAIGDVSYSNAVVKNLGVTDVSIDIFCNQNRYGYIGSLAGELGISGTIENVFCSGSIIRRNEEDMKMNEISPSDIVKWQNEMIAFRYENGKGYSETYRKTMHNQLSCIFNHACRFYGLKVNPARLAGNMGKEETKEMLFWTKDEYRKFSEAVMENEVAFYAFEMLYWTGIRCGELLALTMADFDETACTIRINKSYQRLQGKDFITTPKTKKSNRVIKMPKFLMDEMKEYFAMLYGYKETDRIFPVTKSFLHHQMDNGSAKAGVKRIRVHDLRHSHVSLSQGYF